MTTIPEILTIAVQQHKRGQLREAERLYRQVLALDASEANAWHLLGVVQVQLGRHEAGVECIRRALALNPNWAEGHYNLGKALSEQRKPVEAAACYRRAIELQPDHQEAHNNLGLALRAQGKVEEAVTCHRRALVLNPNYAGAYNDLGIALRLQGKLDQSAACCRRALELRPDLAAAHTNLGLALEAQGGLDEAVAAHRRAIELKPDLAEAHANLANAWQAQANLEEALACCRRALELRPDSAAAHSNLLHTLQYRGSVTLAELAVAHAEFEQKHAAPLRSTWSRHENTRDPQRPLRVGFLSPDFRRHPAGFFLIRMLENLDPVGWKATCYYDETAHDDLTARFPAAAHAWSDVYGVTDEQLAQRIRGDGIDILFDLAGHTAGNRLLVFARKPAPIQITWLGYEGTTGLASMDYILADRYTIPAGQEAHYRERVLRMPDGYVCYDPPTHSPEPGALPAVRNGYVRFGSFNNPTKITPRVVEIWAKVLNRVPRSRLMLKYRGLGAGSVVERYRGMFAALGVDPARLEFSPPSEYAEYLAAHREVDIALDPFPFGGGITTCNALWMGVPVITCPGETFSSRHGLSHLSNVGLTETIAGDLQEYVERAVALACDLPRLAELRSGLRKRMEASPLCDGRRFAANLADVLREAWREWCQKGDA